MGKARQLRALSRPVNKSEDIVGCDIHAIIQRRHDLWPDRWVLAMIPDESRSYGFFSGIAAVRGNYETPERALAAGRGFPWDGLNDSETDAAKMLCWDDGEAHSASWFTLEEAEAWTPTFEYGQEQFDMWLEAMRFVRDHWKLTSADVRAVFGFDN